MNETEIWRRWCLILSIMVGVLLLGLIFLSIKTMAIEKQLKVQEQKLMKTDKTQSSEMDNAQGQMSQNQSDRNVEGMNQASQGVMTTGDGGGLGMSTLDTSWIKRKFLNIVYANESESQKLDIYLPDTDNGPFPVIVAIHGGGFKFGSKDGGDVSSMVEGVKRGYAVVSVGYRLSGEAKFPAAVNDVKTAVRFLRTQADKYNLDTEKMAAWGDSSGGNLAAMLGTSGDLAALETKTILYPEQSSKVQAVVDWFGPINFLTMEEQFKASGITPMMGYNQTADSFESEYIGRNIAEAPAQVKAADPATYISADDPSFFIQHGSADANVPVQQSKNFAAALEDKLESGREVNLTILEGATHGSYQFQTAANLDLVYAFLDGQLK